MGRSESQAERWLIKPSSDWPRHRQGCSLSLILFNIYTEAMLRDTLSGVNEGIRVGGHLILFCIKTVRFADDQATLAGSFKGLQLMMDKMQNTAGEYGMKTLRKLR